MNIIGSEKTLYIYIYSQVIPMSAAHRISHFFMYAEYEEILFIRITSRLYFLK